MLVVFFAFFAFCLSEFSEFLEIFPFPLPRLFNVLSMYMYIVHCTLYMLHSLYTVLLNATCIIRGLHMVETVWPNAGLGSTCIIIVGFGVLLSYDPCTQAGHLGVNQVALAKYISQSH